MPNPVTSIPTMVIEFCQQSIERIAEHGDGWMQYPRSFEEQALLVKDCGELSGMKQLGVFKPFTQTLYIDLLGNPNELPTKVPLGFRLGRNYLLELLYKFQAIGVIYLVFVPYIAKRAMGKMIQEIGEKILPKFTTHDV